MTTPNGRVSDLVGQRFGRLLVLRHSHTSNRIAHWECLCDCGASKVARGTSLRAGVTESCGCLGKERRTKASVASRWKHGQTSGGNKRTYRIWANMISRCTNEKFDAYPSYGGRGIEVCDSWRVFSNFLRDMGVAEDWQSIDRIDCNGNYCPENCRWIESSKQASNRRSNRVIDFGGRKVTLTELATLCGISVGTLWSRLDRGWCIEDAVKPVCGSGRPSPEVESCL